MATKPSSYTEYVIAQRRRNPCLGNLCDFLNDGICQRFCRITCLEFHTADKPPTRRDLNSSQLESFLSEIQSQNSASVSDKPQGRILFVEDLTRELVEFLGPALDIDPLFFASHLHSPVTSTKSAKPSAAILSSQWAKLNFLNLHYQKSLEFGDDAAKLRKIYGHGNVERRVRLLQPDRNTRIGLAQQSCSVLLTKDSGQDWLAVVLVDAPTRSTYRSPEKEMTLQSQPFQGGFEDFLERPSCREDDSSGPGRTSLLEDLVHYWAGELPPGFNVGKPSLLSLSYYPLRIVAAEWVKYVEVLSLCIKQYEYSTEEHAQPKVLDKLNQDLRDLQSWIRRYLQTMQKLKSATKFVKHRVKSEVNKESYNLILEDYEYLTGMVETLGRRLEAMVPLVTTLVQIVDSRESLREAANVRRLTNLALLFIPLSFVTGLFSMNDGVSPHGLWLFFSVAIPLCLVVVVAAHASNINWNGLVERMPQVRTARKPKLDQFHP